ncbi:2-dehydropantoate 2-reductase [BD1-7 clade bacterium]|uniref:2-dehydropantoate 2-reductase n=1 Tax=BD1-7 clade bacterium TaxID=2029982 RepID=A0A5S9N0J0_9GAMM|nr:2-dehydropantoate 2-reductase [BD1-7 clade bacterium]
MNHSLPETQRIHVLGAGSIGLLWSWHLRQAGYPVSLLLRTSEARQQSIACIGHGDVMVDICDASTTDEIHRFLVCTKAFQALDGINLLANHLAENAHIYLLHNGMGPQQQVAETFPNLPVFAGVTAQGALKQGPFSVAYTGKGITRWGPMNAAAQQHLEQLPFAGNLDQIVDPDIQPALWQKLCINACINPLTVHFNCKNGQLATIPEARAMISTILEECHAIAVALSIDHLLEGIESRVYDVIAKTAENSSSMRQDVLNHRPTEIDFINGFIVNQGLKLDIDTPLNARLTESLRNLP